MGFGDPYHKHSIRRCYVVLPKGEITCFRCELPITAIMYYGCSQCNYYIHEICNELPDKVHHPLHPDHPLILFAPSPPSANPSLSKNTTITKLCNECHNPCLGFTYFCSTCDFRLHLRCFLMIMHGKHNHPLSFTTWVWDSPCSVCGLKIDGMGFSCNTCSFSIHPDCTFLPPTVKHHHVHELTFHHEFPRECDQVYCDRCEDMNGGEELDRKLSYYYCKPCDYIAHVRCVTEAKEVDIKIHHFNHEHPLRPYGQFKPPFENCKVCGTDSGNQYYCCKLCNYFIHDSCAEFPRLVKHPRHKEHALTLNKPGSGDKVMLKCTDCEFTLDPEVASRFKHPHHENILHFSKIGRFFICDACGELGEGFRMRSGITEYDGRHFDLHLECFALPGEIEHMCHPHPLLLFPVMFKSLCMMCCTDIEPELWRYCCQECNFSAHLNCVASDLLSSLRSTIKNQSDFCAIVQCEETSYKMRNEPAEDICFSLSLGGIGPHYRSAGVLSIVKSQSLDGFYPNPYVDAKDVVSPVKLCDKDQQNIVGCPHCLCPLSKQVQSEFSSSSPCIDEIYCPICMILIFSPFYSCTHCSSFFHESCAELPREHSTNWGHTFALVADGSSLFKKCACCQNPITGFAYVCAMCEVYLDVICACQVPVLSLKWSQSPLVITSSPSPIENCMACRNEIPFGTSFRSYQKPDLFRYIHIECAVLPQVIKHRIHQHPLGLAMDLAEFGDEYICDACEKDLNPNLWAYRCLDICGGYATSHVTCVINSKRKDHFLYEEECRGKGIGC